MAQHRHFGRDFKAKVAIEAYTVPEPTTLALIGLGGLFLRKRKS